ncbi:hypothetical protein LAU42_08885 [Macrococcus armenti]|uniref:hypothetical protein n=1 Tax=Macrococcus armenti TaxID=2875764 RepID=UPI001CCFC33F|nr:hypothetical protein [Macrococcus armenti]UBH21881.1 hypothetical protein LAU42_08885 [Macrococcus armenti]
MAYTLKQSETQFRGGKNILASEHVQYVHGGATLDGSKFPEGLIEVGTLIARNDSTGKYEPFSDAEGFKNFYILNEDHDHDGKTDAITGAVIIEGSVYLKKLPTADQSKVETFAPLNQNIHFVDHIEG